MRSPLEAAYDHFRPALRATIVFSVFANLLLFVGPLYMLQVYDRVLTSRSLETLTVLTYDSFVAEWGPGPIVKAAFEAECACTLRFIGLEDGVAILNRLKLQGTSTTADAVVGLDGPEVPIMDGSSENFIELIEKAGVISQSAPRHVFRVLEKVAIDQNGRKMSIEPADNFEIDCVIDFPHPFIGRQSFNYIEEGNGTARPLTQAFPTYGREIASARTFGFTHEIDMLRKANLALGGSLDNAIVLTDDGMLNKTPLRFDDEFVRHKILDIIGDLALIGMPLQAKITAEKSGHSVHASLMTKLLKAEHAWEIV